MNFDLTYHYRWLELWTAKHPSSGRRWRGRVDTRRLNAAGKVIGGHNGRWPPQEDYKIDAHRAERRLWRKLARDLPARREWQAYARTQSELNWKGL